MACGTCCARRGLLFVNSAASEIDHRFVEVSVSGRMGSDAPFGNWITGALRKDFFLSIASTLIEVRRHIRREGEQFYAECTATREATSKSTRTLLRLTRNGCTASHSPCRRLSRFMSRLRRPPRVRLRGRSAARLTQGVEQLPVRRSARDASHVDLHPRRNLAVPFRRPRRSGGSA